MIRSREELEREEEGRLAPWAQGSAASAGRRHAEPPHPYRTAYQRDRSRIVHSKAFRRLDSKTQVFLSGKGDHLRNRLTHTIEVASISRTIARALALNEDLAEAIALAHDLGHAPFGHSGEKTLDRLMAGHGGFEHNLQSLRVVDLLEVKYPRFPGLNLSHEVLEGLRKHDEEHLAPDGVTVYRQPSLEAQITDLADEITYYSHDLDDGLDFHLLTPEQLDGVEIWRETVARVGGQFPDLEPEALRAYTIRCLIDREVEDVISHSARRIERSGVRTADDVRRHPERLIAPGEETGRRNRQLRAFLYQNLYYHPAVNGANRRACRVMEKVFAAFIANPALLPAGAAARIEKEGLHRTVCDYIAGMTDRFLLAANR